MGKAREILQGCPTARFGSVCLDFFVGRFFVGAREKVGRLCDLRTGRRMDVIMLRSDCCGNGQSELGLVWIMDACLSLRFDSVCTSQYRILFMGIENIFDHFHIQC